MLTLQEVAELLRCNSEEAEGEIESGRLAGFKVAGQLRVLESEVHRFASYKPTAPMDGALKEAFVSGTGKARSMIQDLSQSPSR